jgi:hypothetical protein
VNLHIPTIEMDLERRKQVVPSTASLRTVTELEQQVVPSTASLRTVTELEQYIETLSPTKTEQVVFTGTQRYKS